METKRGGYTPRSPRVNIQKSALRGLLLLRREAFERFVERRIDRRRISAEVDVGFGNVHVGRQPFSWIAALDGER